jgi:hypothetical protein
MFDINGYKEKIDCFFGLMIENMDIADVKLSDDKWALKEMAAHLIDSASNNHQRFIRLQIEDKIEFPGYDPEIWKNIAKINEFDFLELINLWKGYNYFLLHLVQNIDEKNYENIWEFNGEKLTLKFIVVDYFEGHMNWHIDLYKNRIEEIKNMLT